MSRHIHSGNEVFTLLYLFLQVIVANTSEIFKISIDRILAHLPGKVLLLLLEIFEFSFLFLGQSAYFSHFSTRSIAFLPSLCTSFCFKFLDTLVYIGQLILWLCDTLPSFQLSNLQLYFLDVFQFLIFCIILGKDRRVLLFKAIQCLTSGVGAKCFVTCNGTKFFHLAFVLFLCLNYFLLLCLIRFISSLNQLCLCLHAYHHGNHTSNGSGNQYVWVTEHGSIKKFLGFLHHDNPTIVDGFYCCHGTNAGSYQAVNRCNGHASRAVCAIYSDKSHQHTPKLLIMFNQVGNTA